VVLPPATDESVRPRFSSQAVSVVPAHESVGLSSTEQVIAARASLEPILPLPPFEEVTSVPTEE
jgi:hypothetical protein